MSETFKTRIMHKRDTSANWAKTDPVLLNGEIVIVDTDNGTRTKTGNGAKKYSQLPFDDEIVRNLISSKVSTSQGSDNSGKMLCVDTDGNVKPDNLPKEQVESALGYTPTKTWYVTVTRASDGTVTADETPQEIYEAYQAGFTVYAKTTTFPGFDGVPFLIPCLAAIEFSGLYQIGFATSGTTSASKSPTSMVIFYDTSTWHMWDHKLVSTDDIVDDLTTGDSTKVLSAAQGKALKTMIGNINIPTVPSTLPNPNKLTLTGAVAAEYDGAKAVNVTIPQETDPTVPAWAKAATKPAYTAAEVGADASGTAASAVSAHNTSSAAHNDIRQLISSLTSSKVGVSDIVNNLTSDAVNKPLSAAQGKALKELIDNSKGDDAIYITGVAEGTENGSVVTFNALESGTPPYDAAKAAVAAGKEVLLNVTNPAGDWETILRLSKVDHNVRTITFSNSEIIEDGEAFQSAEKRLQWVVLYDDNTAEYYYIELVNASDMPSSLPNPNALTIKLGDASVTYDGTEAVSITEYAAPMIIYGYIDSSDSTSVGRWETPIPDGQSMYNVMWSAYNAHREIIVDISDGRCWNTVLRLAKFETSERFFEFSNYETYTASPGSRLQTLIVFDDGSTRYRYIEPADLGDIPSTLPNPNSLTFTGGVSKSYNGSSAVTVEIPAKPAAYVTASGTSGIWSYKKWSDGTAECWCTYSTTDVNAARNNYMGFYYSDVLRVNLPFTFSEAPTVTISGGGYSSMTIARTASYTTSQVGIWVVSMDSTATSVDVTAHIMVKGKYA